MVKAYSLYEGSYSVDKTKEFIPFDPKKDDPKDRPGSLFIHVHPFLVDTEEGLVLVDAGLGKRNEDGELHITHNIDKLGHSADDVRYVLLSHLHKDHVSGAVDLETKKLTFPDATYVVQQKEWDRVIAEDDLEEDLAELFQILEDSGKLEKVDGDGDLNSVISYQVSGAHTPHHQVFHLKTDGEHYFFGGDVLPEPEEIFRVFVAKYDYDGKLARDLRAEYWKEGAPQGWIFLFYHSKSIQIGKSEMKEDGSYKVVDVAPKN